MSWMAEITEEQANELRTLQWTDGNYFGPREIGGKWYISEEEVIGSMSEDLRWVRRLPLRNVEVRELELPNLSETNNETM